MDAAPLAEAVKVLGPFVGLGEGDQIRVLRDLKFRQAVWAAMPSLLAIDELRDHTTYTQKGRLERREIALAQFETFVALGLESADAIGLVAAGLLDAERSVRAQPRWERMRP